MSVRELFRDGKLQEAIQLLGTELRDQPDDDQRRTFLFELLCFAGDYKRARTHLTLPLRQVGRFSLRRPLISLGPECGGSAQAVFEAKKYQENPIVPNLRAGTLNGERFRSIEDIDPRLGARLEVFIAGEYMWLPFAHIGSLTMGPPRYLRDLLWASATITAGPALEGKEFGEVLLPVLYPFSSNSESDAVKLGRETAWVLAEEEPLEIPFGQKLFVLDGERSIPILEIRSLQFDDSLPQTLPI